MDDGTDTETTGVARPLGLVLPTQPVEPVEHAEPVVAPTYSTWTLEVRLYMFAMGACLPSLMGIEVLYLAMLANYLPISLAAMALVFLYLLSSACLATCCIAPRLSRNRLLLGGLKLGVAIWTPTAILLFFMTGALCLFVSLLIAAGVYLLCKALVRLYPRNAKFTLRQLMWLTTLVAVIVSVTGAIAHAVGGATNLWQMAVYGVAIGAPGITLMTLIVMLSDIWEAERIRDRATATASGLNELDIYV